MTFAERLRELREKSGTTQARMAAAAGMTRTGYAEIEHGIAIKTYAKLPKLAKALGCRIDDLFPEMDEEKNDSAVGFDDALDDLEM